MDIKKRATGPAEASKVERGVWTPKHLLIRHIERIGGYSKLPSCALGRGVAICAT